MSKSFMGQVVADNTGTWVGNQIRFRLESEAEGYIKNLEARWTLVRRTRVIPSDDPPTSSWDNGKLIPLRAEPKEEPT